MSRGPALVELDGVGKLIAPGETLGAVSAILKPLRCRAPQSIEVAGLGSLAARVGVEAGSEVSLWAFNAPEDRDPEFVLAPPRSAPTGGDTGQIDLSPGVCWLVVRHHATVLDGERDHAPPQAPFAPGPRTVTFSDYRRHERADGAVRAVTDGVLHPRFVHRLSDVHALRQGEALAVETSVRLTATLDVTWSDILSAGLGSLAGIVGAAAPLAVRNPAAASVRAALRAESRFSLVFSGLPNRRTRVAVRRAATPAPDDDPRIAVELADPQELETALHDLLPGLLNCGANTVRTLLEKASFAELSQEEDEAAAALAARLDLGAPGQDFTGMQRALRQLEGAVGEALAELAAERIAGGLAYEYARIPRGGVLLQAVLDQGALERFHAPLCRGDLVPLILEIAGGGAGVTLESYLRQRAVERSRCWGFTLGIGPWAACGRQRRTLARVVQNAPPGRPRVSCVGLGAFEGRWLADVADWIADLRADVPGLAHGGDTWASELGFHLAWHWRSLRFEADGLGAAVDMGLLWGIFDPQDATAVERHFSGALGHPAEVTLQLRIDDRPFRALLPAVAAGRDADFGAALGAAMPWRKGSPGRADPVRRRELYGPLWAHILDQPDAPARSLVTLARKLLADCGDPQLAFLEENYLRLTPTSTVVGLARMVNQNTAAAWADFRAGATLLHGALGTSAVEDGTLETAYALMTGLWAHPHHVRALGAFLLESAAHAGVGDALSRTITIVAGDAGSETALVVAAPAT